MHTIHTREYLAADAWACLDVLRTAVRITGRQFYGPAQLTSWLARTPSVHTFHQRLAPSLTCRVAFDGRGIYAFANITPAGYVDFVMCHPRRARHGAGRRLLLELMGSADAHGVAVLTAQASLAARPLFEACGFEVEENREVLGLACFGMVCPLSL
ncbi:GNAT family N-acetyltransferase [Magnetovibrio sp. PR-2]|uniref:GNAT family N-acetyltransferase n=1 Tax=Magnetovibrio sp. PR-2 TaxID=3120356 RepID=UPI002FCE67D9